MRWWEAFGVRGLVIGGLAVALLARPRLTRDIDGLVMLPAGKWMAFAELGKQFGFVPRDAQFLKYLHAGRMMLLRHEATQIDVDIAMGDLAFETEALDRATRIKVAGVTVPLPTPEDLVIMKAIAHRDRDFVDIDGLLAAYPKLDKKRVRHWVRIFAEMLDAPEIYDDLEKRLKPARKRKRLKKKPRTE